MKKKMGCSSSAPIKQKTHVVNPSGDVRLTIIDGTENLQVFTVDMYDQKTIANLKREIKDDLEVFILNNILLSVMFFENYDAEMARAKTTVSRREQEMSLKLMADHNKQCIMPDTAIELVNQRVRYRWRNGPKRGPDESLVNQRMYVVYDTIEIRKESEDLDHYSDIDKANYRAVAQKSMHAGYVKLKHPQYTTLSGSKTSSSLSGSIYNGRDHHDIYGSNFDINQISPPGSSSPDNSEDYDYAGVNIQRTKRPINHIRSSSNTSSIPPTCLKAIKEKNLYYTHETEDLFILHHYYDSTEFMKHFNRQTFPGELGTSLGFSEDEVMNATYNSRAVYCDTEDELGLLKCEVIPAVINPWPGLNVWASRQRPIVQDILKSIKYQWPTMHMLVETLKLPAVVVPRGFLQRRGKNPDFKFEWEVCYPKAEKYMHMRMSHAQMKCYLFLATLHKTYIEPMTQEKGLLLDHIRTLIYWECENNFRDWPENRLGEKIIRLLRSLNQSMGRRELRDYFIENKNVFANIPPGSLLKAQQMFHAVCERPVAHFVHALGNLNYSKKRFYPMLDFDELRNILRTKDSMNLINPTLYIAHFGDPIDSRKLKNLPADQQWIYRQLEVSRKHRQQNEPEEQNLTVNHEEEEETVDLKWRVKDSIDQPKLVHLIKFFVEHFLKIAEKSVKYHGATSQALLYLKHSWYLTKVMEDPMLAGEIYALELQKKIAHLEEQCKELCNDSELTPSTPVRNSMSQQIQVQVLKNKTVDLNKISENFKMGFQKPAQKKNSVPKPTQIGQMPPQNGRLAPQSAEEPSRNGEVPKAPRSWVQQNSAPPQQNGHAEGIPQGTNQPVRSSRNWAEENILKRRSKVKINPVVEHM